MRPVKPNFSRNRSVHLEALFLSIILIYLVLASQFESLTDPFAIMLSLPMSLLGAFLDCCFLVVRFRSCR